MKNLTEKENIGGKLIYYPPKTPEHRLIWEAFFIIVITVTVGVFGRLANTDVFYTWIITCIFGINLIVRFILINEKGDWLFFLLGVLGGGGNDLMSMINGVYNYNSQTILPFLDGLLPLWMILFWGQIFLLFRKVFHLKWFKGDDFQKDGRFLRGWVDLQLIIDLVVLVSLRIVIYNFYLDPLLPWIIYAIVLTVRFILIRPRLNELFIMLILPYAWIFEGLMVSFGFYEYYNPIFLGQPVWLYLWWLFLVPIFLKEIFDRAEYYFKEKA